jgi:K+-transporting ATPase ATPase C chain
MRSHLRANLWLLALTVLLVCVIYPGVLLVIGQTVFRSRANGSLILDQAGKPIGSRLIAQPFTGDEYFQPRPSAVSYNAAASGASNWGANNYLLRDRVARQLGPIVKYQSGAKTGRLVGSDIETWFQQDRFNDRPAIVAQWAETHSTLAQNWVKADAANSAFVVDWQSKHADEVARWMKENPDNPQPKPEDLAVAFFTSFSHEHPGTFPVSTEHKTADGKTEKRIEPVKEGSDIQSIFFDMWRQEHPQADIEPVPTDMVMASGSGLDPHITLKNALYQLDRVAGKWAAETKRDSAAVRQEIGALLLQKAEAPLHGLVGVELINVLEVNLALQQLYRPLSSTGIRE